jgi:hypothetical protein
LFCALASWKRSRKQMPASILFSNRCFVINSSFRFSGFKGKFWSGGMQLIFG